MTPKAGTGSQNAHDLPRSGVFLNSMSQLRQANGGVGFWVSVGRVSKVTERCPHCGIGVDVDIPKHLKPGAER
jgi:hypothetical protein